MAEKKGPGGIRLQPQAQPAPQAPTLAPQIEAQPAPQAPQAPQAPADPLAAFARPMKAPAKTSEKTTEPTSTEAADLAAPLLVSGVVGLTSMGIEWCGRVPPAPKPADLETARGATHKWLLTKLGNVRLSPFAEMCVALGSLSFGMVAGSKKSAPGGSTTPPEPIRPQSRPPERTPSATRDTPKDPPATPANRPPSPPALSLVRVAETKPQETGPRAGAVDISTAAPVPITSILDPLPQNGDVNDV